MSRCCSDGAGEMKPCRYGVAELLPHRPPMILLDEILGYDEGSLSAAVRVGPASLFVESGAVPAHIGFEYMAQACGAFAGVVARERGEPVKIGFVLGTRQYRAHVPSFRCGDRLVVTVSVLYQDEQMGAFDCRIEIAGTLAAEAQLSVYQPDPAQLAAEGPVAAP
jgi:predicted hotdog family 3-hydroxylacyl-ACP dehydratase